MLNDIEQVRFDRDNWAESTAAITRGLMRVGKARGVSSPPPIAAPTQPAMLEVGVQMNVQFQVTPNQVVFGVCAFLLVGGLLYLAASQGDSPT
jgi:hypothetical protein